jgi:pimeloyl-ACP methyl ester carboxylesterase
MKTQVPHLLVVIPGIGGSALRKDGEDLFRLSAPVAWRLLRSRGRSLDELVPDDPALLDDPDFDDGVEPAGLIELPASLPGLARLTGYGGLRATLHERYDLDELNYVEFAYDWRRDIRHAAERLAETIAERLVVLDSYVGRAEVIVVAHSMGGLVARWWLDRLGGAERCRGLVTLGTPYRGSPKAVRMLAGGYVWRSFGSRRFADVLRAFPSVHQLLPMYPSVFVGGSDEPSYVHELEPGIPGIDRVRAGRGRELLLQLNESERPALTTVIGGTSQPTLQSVEVGAGGEPSFPNRPLPAAFGSSGGDDGDGTVPWIASRPLDYGSVRGLTPTFVDQSHGGLSRERGLLDAVMARIDHLLVDDDPARSATEAAPPIAATSSAHLGLGVADEYVAGEPVAVQLRASELPSGTEITVAIDDGVTVTTSLDGEVAAVELGPLDVGSHHVVARLSAPTGSLAVHDVIDVWPADEA